MSPENPSPSQPSAEVLQDFELSEQQTIQLEEQFAVYVERAKKDDLSVGTHAYEHAQGFKECVETGSFTIEGTSPENTVIIHDGQRDYSFRRLLSREFRTTDVVDEIEKSILAGDMEAAIQKVDALIGVIASESEKVLKANLKGGGSVAVEAESELTTADQIPASPEDSMAGTEGDASSSIERKNNAKKELEEIRLKIENDPNLRQLSIHDKQFKDAKSKRGRVYTRQQKGEITDEVTSVLAAQQKEVMDYASNNMNKLPQKDQDLYRELMFRRSALISELNS